MKSTAYSTHRPEQFKSTDSEGRELETCYEKMRRWLTVGCQLGCLATTNGSTVTHRFLSLHLSLCQSLPPFHMEQRSGEKLRILLHEQYRHQISIEMVSQVQYGKHHHQQQQQQCRWAGCCMWPLFELRFGKRESRRVVQCK